MKIEGKQSTSSAYEQLPNPRPRLLEIAKWYIEQSLAHGPTGIPDYVDLAIRTLGIWEQAAKSDENARSHCLYHGKFVPPSATAQAIVTDGEAQ